MKQKSKILPLWQRWGIGIVFMVFAVWDFLRIDSSSHSVSDTLINFIPQLLLAALVLVSLLRVSSRNR